VYAVHLTFKNVKSTPVKFEYKEIIDSQNTQFKIILKESSDERASIQVTDEGTYASVKSLLSSDSVHMVDPTEV
jgi:hypothetical protein